MTATADDIGKHAQALTAQGIVHATGDIVAYCDVPTVTIATLTQGHVSWRADLTEVTHRWTWHRAGRPACRWGGMPGNGNGRELCDCPPPAPFESAPGAVFAVPSRDWILQEERTRIVAAIAAPDNALLAALIEINTSAQLMRDWVLSIVRDETDQ